MFETPFRLAVLIALTNLFERINPADGYTYDLTGRVHRGRLVFGEDDAVPLISILEAPLPDSELPTPLASGIWHGPWRLMIQGWVDDDKANPTDPAHFLMADIKRALANERKRAIQPGKGNTMLNMPKGRVSDIIVGPGVVRPPEEGVQELANFYLSVTLEIVENMSDPYA